MENSRNHEGAPCKTCGEIIQIYSLSGYCRKCWKTRGNSRKYISRICPKCGNLAGNKGQSLCSPCRIALRIEKHKDNLTIYHLIRIQNRQMPEHRYIWEKYNGKLKKGYVVHHLNGLNGDNRIENLIALNTHDHNSKLVEQSLQFRIRELEKRLSS